MTVTGDVQYAQRLHALDPRQLRGSPWMTTKDVALRNGREREYDVDKNGFELAQLDVARRDARQFYDPTTASQVLYPAATKLLEQRFPGATALVFDHIARGGDPSKPLVSRPVPLVHNDYSVDSGKPRIKALLADVSDPAVLDHVLDDRVAIVNVWVPLAPVEQDPLAFVDWKTTQPTDLIVVKRQYTERTGETSMVYENSSHDWVYFPDMQPGEVALLKVWDTPDDSRARFAIHAAPKTFRPSIFSSDRAPPPRESIELRCMVLFHPKAKTNLLTAPFVAPHIRRLQTQEAGRAAKGFETLVSKTYVDGDPHAW